MKKKSILVDTNVFISRNDADHLTVGNISRHLMAKKAEESEDQAVQAKWILLVVAACSFATASKQENTLPPKLGEALLLWFCRNDLGDAIAGDLQEKFAADILSAGPRRARFRYWIRVIGSVGPLMFARLRNWGLFAAALEYGRRKIGL
jgi:hypothetical protein